MRGEPKIKQLNRSVIQLKQTGFLRVMSQLVSGVFLNVHLRKEEGAALPMIGL